MLYDIPKNTVRSRAGPTRSEGKRSDFRGRSRRRHPRHRCRDGPITTRTRSVLLLSVKAGRFDQPHRIERDDIDWIAIRCRANKLRAVRAYGRSGVRSPGGDYASGTSTQGQGASVGGQRGRTRACALYSTTALECGKEKSDAIHFNNEYPGAAPKTSTPKRSRIRSPGAGKRSVPETRVRPSGAGVHRRMGRATPTVVRSRGGPERVHERWEAKEKSSTDALQ